MRPATASRVKENTRIFSCGFTLFFSDNANPHDAFDQTPQSKKVEEESSEGLAHANQPV
jgi:hypothetical protein